jgi:hypothetical protein
VKLILAILTFLIAPLAHADFSAEGPLGMYAAKILHRSIGEIELQTTRYTTPTGDRIFGITYDKPRAEGEQFAAVFVIDERQGKIQEIASSAPFSYADNQGFSIQGLDAKSAKNFSLSLSFRSVCGGGSYVYKFAERNGTWRVAGLDTTDYQCDAENNDIGPNSDERSKNFLTGLVIETERRKDRVVHKAKKRVQFPELPLSSFAIGDSSHDAH